MEDNTMNRSRCQITVLNTPRLATIACHADDPELPKLTATVATQNKGTDDEYQHIDIHIEATVLATMNIYRGKNCAIRMVRGALRGAMSWMGRHRRLTKNRQAPQGEVA